MTENIITQADQEDFDRRWKLAEEQMLQDMTPDEIYRVFSTSKESQCDFWIDTPGPSVMGFLKWLAEPLLRRLEKRKLDS